MPHTPLARIAFATSAGHATLAPDDRLAVAALAARGVIAVPAVWDDERTPWADFDAVVVRSCWDYHRRAAEFRGWIARVEDAGVALWNPAPVLRWNLEKSYLRELAGRGVPIVPTRWVEPDDAVSLAAVLGEMGWRDAVVKPVVSASAHATWRVARADAAGGTPDEARFRDALAGGPLMVQPYLPQIAAEGEWSFVFLGGTFSHAVMKRPAAGDFRVQYEHGGTAEPVVPDTALLAQARAVAEAAPKPWLYLRVDGCVVDGELRLMELEMLEPSLFLDRDDAAPARFAAAIAAAIAAVVAAADVPAFRVSG